MQTSPAHRRSLALLLASTAVLAACGGGDASPEATSPAITTPGSVAATTTAGAPASVASGEPVTVPEVGPVQFDVVVGRDAGADRIETVTVGSDVTINVTNPDAADEFHLHGIDLERAVDAGVMATFNFTADTVGTFELESHVTETVLIVIEVVAA